MSYIDLLSTTCRRIHAITIFVDMIYMEDGFKNLRLSSNYTEKSRIFGAMLNSVHPTAAGEVWGRIREPITAINNRKYFLHTNLCRETHILRGSTEHVYSTVCSPRPCTRTAVTVLRPRSWALHS